jgi:small subunit ribosomal protein S6
MFIFDPAVTADWDSVRTELNRLLERAGARVIALNKWDERRLTYEIRGRKRGIYALTYFETDETKIPDLERDARLSEAILRSLVLTANHLTDDEIQEIAARPADHSLAEAERIGGRGGYRSGGPPSGGDRGRPRRDDRPEGGREVDIEEGVDAIAADLDRVED